MHRSDLRSCRFVGSVILLLALLPAGVSQADYLGGIRFDHAVPSYLPHVEDVYVTIDYKIDDPGGGRVFARPYTNGAPSPGYSASGAALLPQGTGTTQQHFRILGGDVTVDQVRVFLVSADQSEQWLEIFVPVQFVYGPHGVYDIQPNHTEYSRLRHGMSFTVDFAYAVDAPNCRIFARPWNGSHLEPGYAASGSALLPPSGSYSQYFSFDQDADISHIRFQVRSDDQSELYAEFFVPFDLHWRAWGVYDITFNFDPLTSLHHDHQLTASFTFDHEEPNGLRIWAQTYQDGHYCPGTAYQGSPLVPPGATSLTRYSRVMEGSEWSDHMHFVYGTSSEDYESFDVPLLAFWDGHAIPWVEFTPASPAIMSPGERLEMDFGYNTDDAAGVRVFGRGAFDGAELFGMTSQGSPLYPAPAGTGFFWLYYDNPTEANSIRFKMTSGDQSVTYLEWFQPGMFLWGESMTVTPVEPLPAVTRLDRCYPNPFNPNTTIPVLLSGDAQVRLAIYDVRGRLVRELLDGRLPAGRHEVPLRGEGMASGAYICRLETPDGVQTQRLTLLK